MDQNETGDLPAPGDFDQKPFAVLRWVRDRCDWPPVIQLCYLYLYSYRSAQGDYTPGVRGLARKLGISPTKALEAVEALENLGTLSVHRTKEPGTKEAAKNTYVLRPPWEARQHMDRVQRGRHAASPEGGVFSNKEHVLSSEEHVLSNEQQGVLQSRTQVFSSGERIEPSLREKEKSLLSSAPAEQSRRRRKSPAASSEDPNGAPAQELVRSHDSWLKEQHGTGIPSANWSAQVAIAKGALAGRKGGAPIPPNEAQASMEWARGDRYWKERLIAGGMTVLRPAWAAWKTGSTAPARRGAYKDHTAGEPEYASMRVAKHHE